MKKLLISFSIGAALLGAAVPMLASASTLSSAQIQSVISLLQAFGTDSATIANVQQSLTGASVSTTAASSTAVNSSLIGLLRLGDKGDSVKLLQTLLASDPSIYPEGTVSGVFGPLTQKALKRYQQKHGLDQVGFVGRQRRRLAGLGFDHRMLGLVREEHFKGEGWTLGGDGHPAGRDVKIAPNKRQAESDDEAKEDFFHGGWEPSWELEYE